MHKLAKPTFTLFIILLAYLVLCLLISKDYGLTFDERTEYRSAQQLKQYFTQKTSYKNTIESVSNMEPKLQRHSPLLDPYFRAHLALFSMLNSGESYNRYHFLNMLFAGSVLIVSAYLLMYKATGSIFYSSATAVLVIFTPRIFGDLAANPKDIPFAAFYLAAITAIYIFGKLNFSFTRILVLGLLFGVVQSLRTIGFSIYFIFVAYQIYLAYSRRAAIKEVLQLLPPLILIFIVANFFMVSTWPYMGANYFKNMGSLVTNASDFANWDKEMLFMGNYINKDTRPWYYLFVWLAVTTPLYILIPAFLPIFIRRSAFKSLMALLFIAISTTFVLYLAVRPNVYNGPRHFLFIYPMLAVLAILSFLSIINHHNNIFKITVCSVLIASGIFTAVKLIALHPYQYIYFNELTLGLKGAYHNFDIDYWGASYKEAVEWLNQDQNQKVKVAICEHSASFEASKNSNLILTDSIAEADYYICSTQNNQIGETVYTVQRDSVPLNFVIKVESHQLDI